MKQDKPLSIEFNLRTRALGVFPDGPDLYLTAVHNKVNNLRLSGWDSLEAYEQLPDDEVKEFIEEFQARGKVKRADVMLVIPRSQVQIHLADFPVEAASSIEEVMEYQLVNFFPGNLEEYQFFPQILSKGDQLRVMIVALRKETLGMAFALLRKWDLKAAGITLSTLATCNGLAKSQPNTYAKSKLCVFQFFPAGLEVININEGRLMGSHYFPIAEDATEEDISGQLEEAFSRSRTDPNGVDRYLWSGTVPEKLADFLQDNLGFPRDDWQDGVGTAIPAQAMTGFGAAVSAVQDKVPFGLNMLAENLRKRHKRLPVMLATLLLSFLAIYWFVGEINTYRGLKAEQGRLTRQLSQVTQRAREVSDAQGEMEAAETQQRLYSRYRVQGMLLKMLFQLSQELPDNTYLTTFQIKNGEDLTLQGESDDPYTTQRILTRQAFLKDVQPGNAITSGRNSDGKKRFMFKATIVLEALR